MKALMKTEKTPGAKIKNIDIPEPGPKEVLIKIKAAAICGTDIHIYEWDSYARERINPPMIFGHEGCGEVVKVGNQVTNCQPGDLVAVETHIPCGACYQCRTGFQHICENMAIIGVHTNGLFSEHAKIPSTCCWRLPKNTNPDLGAVLEPIGVAVNGILKEDINNKNVAVFGCGPIGQFGLAAVEALGAIKVFAVDPVSFRLDMAKKLVPRANVLNPAHNDVVKTILEATNGKGVDVSLEISGAEKAVNWAFQAVGKRGRVSLIGLPSKHVELNLTQDIIYKEARVYGSTGRLMWQTWYDMEKLLGSGKFNPLPVITHRFSLEDFDKAFKLAESGEAGKILFYP